MRALSAIGFLISVCGLLLACYNQFGVVPYLQYLDNNPDLKVNDFLINQRETFQNTLTLISTISLIAGVFSVLFCSLVYLRKRTRMTLLGMIIGFVTATMAIIHFLF